MTPLRRGTLRGPVREGNMWVGWPKACPRPDRWSGCYPEYGDAYPQNKITLPLV